MKAIAIFCILASMLDIALPLPNVNNNQPISLVKRSFDGPIPTPSPPAAVKATGEAQAKPKAAAAADDQSNLPYCDTLPNNGQAGVAGVSESQCPSDCPDLGLASRFNVIAFGNFEGSSDVQGRIGVEGDAQFQNGFSTSDQLQIAKCSETTVFVKGSLNWQQGRNHNGNIAVGKASSVSENVLDGCRVITDPNAFDFATAKTRLIEVSKDLAGRKRTVKSKRIDDTLKVSYGFSGAGGVEVAELQSNELGNRIKQFAEPTGVKADSLLVFNVRGASPSIKDMDMEGLKNFNVLFNFPEATSLQISGVAVRGSVLAPNADLKNATGVIWGHAFVKSASGSIQYNWKKLACVDSCPNNATAGVNDNVAADGEVGIAGGSVAGVSEASGSGNCTVCATSNNGTEAAANAAADGNVKTTSSDSISIFSMTSAALIAAASVVFLF